ncbi:hypothetical protein GTP46_19660 [Duganella sp. FT135W]|uniref:Uncharacterized protein n=1 Tax=Duganella flavida TaxID=2692175 RepID=A0A6L8KG93_9BURK|nr:hypothetical protein [Duganella flavida]MYM24854.1 hypothetical protein [Duganella flavida]
MHKLMWYLALLLAMPARAAEMPPDWQPVEEMVLASLRGGLDTGQGLMVSIGIERLVSINGSTVSSASFSVGANAQADAQTQGLLPSNYTVVQNGVGNQAMPGAMPGAMAGLVLQNSANDQLLRSQTTISASVNSLSALRNINFEGSLRQALAYGVGPH